MTLPRLEYKTLGTALDDQEWWGSQFPEEHGVRNAIVAVTGVRDEVGDIIVPGAFKDSLDKIQPKMCLGHDWNRPIGIPEVYEELLPGDPRLPKKDRFGNPWPTEAGALVTRNRYMLGTKDGRDAYEHANFFKEKTAFSIGYVPDPEHTRKRLDAKGRPTRYLHKVDVYEWGPVLHGANTLAGLMDGKALPIETKARYVRDSRYWGYPVGTPITGAMRPRGPIALQRRREGQDVSREVGVTAKKPTAGSPGERVKPTDAVREDAQAGLFAAPASERLPAPKAKGAEEEHLIALRDAFLYELNAINNSHQQGARVDPLELNDDDGRILDKLIDEGITPAELEEDLGEMTFHRDDERIGDIEARKADVDEFIADVLDEYRVLYNRALRQHARESGSPDRGTDTPSPAWPGTTSVASMKKTEAAKRALAMSDEELRAHDEELTGRAAELGKAGQVTPAHQAIKAEIAKRAAAPSPTAPDPTDTSTTEEWVADFRSALGKLTPAQRQELRGLEIEQQLSYVEHRKTGADHNTAVQAASESDRGGYPMPSDQTEEPAEEPTAPEGEPAEEPTAPEEPAALEEPAEDTEPPKAQPDEETAPEQPAAEPEAAEEPEIPRMTAQQRGLLHDAREDGEGRLITSGHHGVAWPLISLGLLKDSGRMGLYWLTDEGKRVREALGEDTSDPHSRPDRTTAAMWRRNPVKATERLTGPRHAEYQALDRVGQREYENARAEGDDHATAMAAARGDEVDEGPEAAEQATGTSQPVEPAAAPQAAEEPGVEETQEPIAPEAQDGTPTINGVPMVAEDDNDELTPESYSLTLDNGDVMEVRRYSEEYTEDSAKPWRASLHRFQTDEVEEFGDHASAEEATAALTSGYDGELPAAPEQDAPEGLGAEQAPEDTGAAEGAPQDTATIAAEEIAEANEVADAAYGVTEAEDGEFEVEADVADRQDRIADLLSRSENNALDLTQRDDASLRSTHADLLSELRLQQHLDARQRHERAQNVAATIVPGEITEPEGEQARRRNAEPGQQRPRPGVAGAAEDLAEALESGDQQRIDAARARLGASLNRSRSESPSVAELRTIFESGSPGPDELRALAEAIRAETRARRNEQARGRRRARRFERDRLRGLVRQVEQEMGRRGMRFDALPDDNGLVELPVPVATWASEVEHISWSGADRQKWTASGANWSAEVQGSSLNAARISYEWTVRDDRNKVVASGRGPATDPAAGRDAVAIALRNQVVLGNLPPDAVLPALTVSGGSSATPPGEIEAATQEMRRLLDDPHRTLNPVTGLPDPLAEAAPLSPPVVRLFGEVRQVVSHLRQQSLNHESTRRMVEAHDWGQAELSSGGALVLVPTRHSGALAILHAGTGMSVGAPSTVLRTRAQGKRVMRMLESMPDDNGYVVGWEPGREETRAAVRRWTSGGDSGPDALLNAIYRRLAAEDLRAGKWRSPFVAEARSSRTTTAPNNPSRVPLIRRVLGGLTNLLDARGDAADKKKTLDQAYAADTLSKLNAPDVAAVLLRRRAAELRTEHGAEADARGATVLDDLSRIYLSAHSPQAAPGERVTRLRPDERIAIADGGDVRVFRVLTPTRVEGDVAATAVLEEATGVAHTAAVSSSTEGAQLRIAADYLDEDGNLSQVSTAVSATEFAILAPEDPVPSAAEMRKANLADADLIPQEVLDVAAQVLPESSQEQAERRAAAVDGRAPAPRSPQAPQRTAPAPAEVVPEADRVVLADVQARAMESWVGPNVALEDQPQSGGFASLDDVRAFLAQAPTEFPAAHPFDFLRSQLDPQHEKAPKKPPVLSPGGHFLVIENKTVVHIRSALTVWGMGTGATGDFGRHFPEHSYAFAAQMAGALERVNYNGLRVDWTKDAEQVRARLLEIVERLGGKQRAVKHPLNAPARILLATNLANAKKTPAQLDLNLLAGAVEGRLFEAMPNPGALVPMELSAIVWKYQRLGGKRGSLTDLETKPATGKADKKLAGDVAREMELAMLLLKVAPLNAVTRLERLISEWEGREVTSESGTYRPAEDARTMLDQALAALRPAKAPKTPERQTENTPATV